MPVHYLCHSIAQWTFVTKTSRWWTVMIVDVNDLFLECAAKIETGGNDLWRKIFKKENFNPLKAGVIFLECLRLFTLHDIQVWAEISFSCEIWLQNVDGIS